MQMQFVHPEVLWALSALTIPVLVHLFSFRRHKKIAFSQTAFLKEVRMESKSRNRIRNWLVLLMRLLAMAAIILAFAEPYLPTDTADGDGGARSVSIYLDTSPSMELEGRNGPMFEAARNGAMALVESLAASDRYHIVTSSMAPGDRRWLNRDEALERLASARPGHAAPAVGDVLLHQQEYLTTAPGRKQAYLFTDLQRSSHGFPGRSAGMVDTALAVRFITQPAQPQVNVRIDSVWFATPMRLAGRSEELHVRITHDAGRPVDDLPLSLYVNGAKAAIGSFGITPGLATDTVLRFRHDEAGPVYAMVSTTDAPVTFDDALYFGYTVEQHVQVLLIQGRDAGPAEQVALTRLFGDAALHEVRAMDAAALDYGAMESADLIVLQGVSDPSNGLVASLLRNVEAGKCLWMLPPPEEVGNGWNELLIGLGAHGLGPWMETEEPTRLGRLHHDHPVFEGVFARAPEQVDLPNVKGWHTRSRNASLERHLLSFADGRPLMTTGVKDLGRFYFCAAPLDATWSNLAQHALLVPIALRMAETSRASGIHQFIAGRETTCLLQGLDRSSGTDIVLRHSGAGSEDRQFLASTQVPGGVEVRLPLGDIPPGTYMLESMDATGSGQDSAAVVMALGINPPRAESQLEVWDPEDWKQALVTRGWKRAEVLTTDVEDIVGAVEVLEAGTPLWLNLVALALLFLLIEMILLKRVSAGPSSKAQEAT